MLARNLWVKPSKDTNHVSLDPKLKMTGVFPLLNVSVDAMIVTMRKMKKDFIEQLTEMFTSAGFKISALQPTIAGLDIIHEMGGVRMGKDENIHPLMELEPGCMPVRMFLLPMKAPA